MSATTRLHDRIEHRDPLVFETERLRGDLRGALSQAVERGDLAQAQAALARLDQAFEVLGENLRSYQAELRAQADELAQSQGRAAAALARFASLFTAMPVAVLLVTREGELIDHNERASQLFGLRPQGTGTRFLHGFVDPADYQVQVWPLLAKGGSFWLGRVRFLTERGTVFDGELHVAPLPPAVDRPGCMTCAVVDRSEPLAQMQALNDALDQLGTSRALLAESARLAHIGGFDIELPAARWQASPELCRLIDWAGAAPPGLEDLLALGAPAQAEAVRHALGRAVADGSPFDLELELRTPGGRALHTLVLGRRLQAPGGREHVVGLVQDISPQLHAMAARETAEAANRAKSQFLTRMSHELRTPLNAVIGFTQLMRMEAARGDLTVKPKRLEMMDTAARHLLEVINEVLDVSRIEHDKLALTIEPVPVAPLLHECLTLVQGLADAAGVTLVPLAGSEAVLVLADRLRLKEVLINLLSNAVKYNRPQGQVQVHLNGDQRQVRIAVTDTGRGLDEAALAGLFQPFNRLGAEATAIEGSGIGLYVSKRFVEAMHGCLDVSSRSGTGSTFTVMLPRV